MLDYEILDDTAWLASAPAPSDNWILQARLKEAAATHHPYHENVRKNLHALLQYGLVVLVPDSSKDESLASYIARTLLNFQENLSTVARHRNILSRRNSKNPRCKSMNPRISNNQISPCQPLLITLSLRSRTPAYSPSHRGADFYFPTSPTGSLSTYTYSRCAPKLKSSAVEIQSMP